jgi:hypothetical protein
MKHICQGNTYIGFEDAAKPASLVDVVMSVVVDV